MVVWLQSGSGWRRRSGEISEYHTKKTCTPLIRTKVLVRWQGLCLGYMQLVVAECEKVLAQTDINL